jgi:hypothetical protein
MIGVVGLVPAGVADWALAFGVGPAGAVGDQLSVVSHQEPADDLPERAELRFGGLDQSGAHVVPEPEVAAGRVRLAGAACARRCSRPAPTSITASTPAARLRDCEAPYTNAKALLRRS